MARRKYLGGAEQVDLLSLLGATADSKPRHVKCAQPRILRPTPIAPLLRWPGGKSEELNIIRKCMPSAMRNYFEPFLVGGAVFLSTDDGVPAYLNDLSDELIDFYAEVADGGSDLCQILQQFDRLWKTIEDSVDGERVRILAACRAFNPGSEAFFGRSIDAVCGQFREEWEGLLTVSAKVCSDRLWPDIISSTCDKVSRIRKQEAAGGLFSDEDIVANITAAIKAAVYYHIRWIYNQFSNVDFGRSLRSAVFFFIREYSYAAMFRYNASGAFNVPYGGISYNKKFMADKIGHCKSPAVRAKLAAARMEKMDFGAFFAKHHPGSGDFIFVDPPYDPDYSNYGRRCFGQDDHRRLADWLLTTPANWMLVIKSTDFIRSLYFDKGVNIKEFDKKYLWTIKERNVRDVVHLMVSNY